MSAGVLIDDVAFAFILASIHLQSELLEYEVGDLCGDVGVALEVQCAEQLLVEEAEQFAEEVSSRR